MPDPVPGEGEADLVGEIASLKAERAAAEARAVEAEKERDRLNRVLCEVAGFAHSGIESLEDAREVARCGLKGARDV